MSTTWTPERTAKFRATMAAKAKERADDEAQDPHTAALKKFVTKKKPKRKVKMIPLDAIPDDRKPKRKSRAKAAASNGAATMSREEEILAAIRLLLDLADRAAVKAGWRK